MKLSRYDLAALAVLCTSVIIFFLPLFYPELKLFATPDGSLSDIFHFNYPLKNLLHSSLVHNALPVWTNLVGMGFPPVAEAEIGTYNLINLILFKLFTTPVAYNLGYVVTFLLFASGMYFVMRNFRVSAGISMVCAYIFTFSGFHIAQIAHYNHLQTLSYFPFIFLLWKHTLENKSSKSWLLLPLVVSQMIFAGHFQYVFMFGVMLILYTFFFRPKREGIGAVFINYKTITILLLTAGLSAIQLLPSYEYFAGSQRNSLVNLFTTHFTGLSLPHLLQFISPYILGDPRVGTYNVYLYRSNFWESFSYIGIIPILLVILSLLFVRKNSTLRKFWIIILVLLVLALEGNSPFYFLFSFAPLSWFRIYSRFIEFISFFFIIIFGLVYSQCIDFLYKRFRTVTRIIQILIAIVIGIDLWFFASTYNPMVSVRTVLTPPESVLYLHNYSSKRIYTYRVGDAWFSYFNTHGFKNIHAYMYLFNGLEPNLNMLYDIPQIQVYSGFMLSKLGYLDHSVQSDALIDTTLNTATLTAVGVNTLRLTGADFVISPLTISNPELSLVRTIQSTVPSIKNIHIYQLDQPNPAYYIAHRAVNLTGVREIESSLADPLWNQKHDAIVEGALQSSRTTIQPDDHIESVTDTDLTKVFRYTTAQDGYFILSTYFYPGWRAKLDGKIVHIQNGNIYAMAVSAPKGTHTVEFEYVPASLYTGAAISGVTLFLYAFIIVRIRRKRASDDHREHRTV